MLRIELSNWQGVRTEASRIRFTVFVDEQKVPPEIELDEHDRVCIHALAFDAKGRAVGTGRLLPDGHIGRMAVLQEARNQGVGGAILKRLIDAARKRGDREVALSAQVHAVRFYLAHGFVPKGKEYLEAGIRHQAMTLKL